MELDQPTIHASAFVAPTASIYGDVHVAQRAAIMFGAVLRGEFARISVGESTNIQDNAVLHCDEDQPCIVGDMVTVGHAAVLHGTHIGNHCLIGIGAKALNGSHVGEGAWLAAGSLLPEGKSIPPWTLAIGIPAKPLRELTAEEIERQRDGVADYQKLRAAYRALLT